MFGLNKSATIERATRSVTRSGSADESIVTLYTGVRCAIQAHVLNNLPPPEQRHYESGEQYNEEFRMWCRCISAPDVRDDDYVTDETTGFKYRVVAVIDDAGRGHHWLIRLRKYS